MPGDASSRKNPASIRRFFYDVVAREFGKSPARAATGLTEVLNAAEEKRAFRRKFAEETVYRILSDKQTISFNQLSSLGLHYGVPMALITIFTQSRADMQNKGRAYVLGRLGAFRGAIEQLEALVSNCGDSEEAYRLLAHEAFEDLRKRYLETLEDPQPSLALPIPKTNKRAV